MTERIKKFFKIETKYKFELGDFFALAMVINVILVMTIGLMASWFGLVIAVIGLIFDFICYRKINSVVMHIATMVLNIFFLIMYA